MTETTPPPRLRIVHVILSRGFAGSERSTAESCIAQCVDHDVLLIVRQGHRRQNTGASIVDHLDPRVQVREVPAYLFTRWHLQKIIAEWKADVVHAHLRRSTRLLSRCRTTAVKVSTLHLRINGPQFLDMDGLVCISPWQLATIPPGYRGLARLIRNSLLPHPRLAAERVRELRAEMGADAQTFLIGGVGRLSHSKGWDVLLQAFAAARLPGARLALVGEGRERGRLEALGGPAVQFLGYRANAKDYFQAFDLFVCPSRSEPMGRVIMEALDAGVPVIAADAEGPKEIFAEYPGVLVPIGDIAALSAALEAALAQRGQPQPAVDISAHHLERVSADMVAFYRDLLARRRGG